MNEVLNMVATVGWPIASCLMCMWFIYHNSKATAEEREKEREAHEKEMEAITAAINANTVVLEALKERIGGVEK